MEKDTLHYWLQVVANVGLLVGLVFVGFQLIQDRQLKTAELIAGSLQEAHTRNIALMGEDPASSLSKLEDGDQLDDRERFIARAYFDARFANWTRNSILENLGLLAASWNNGVVLADHLWANKYGIQAVESYLGNSSTISGSLRDRLSTELKRVRSVYLDRTSRTIDD